jgi:hypothetical protein
MGQQHSGKTRRLVGISPEDLLQSLPVVTGAGGPGQRQQQPSTQR